MMSPHDGSCAFRSGDGAAPAVASAIRALRRLLQTRARLWLARTVAHPRAAGGPMVLLDVVPGVLVGESAEARHG